MYMYIYIEWITESKLTEEDIKKLSALKMEIYTLCLEVRGIILFVRRINHLCFIVVTTKDCNPVKDLSA